MFVDAFDAPEASAGEHGSFRLRLRRKTRQAAGCSNREDESFLRLADVHSLHPCAQNGGARGEGELKTSLLPCPISLPRSLAPGSDGHISPAVRWSRRLSDG